MSNNFSSIDSSISNITTKLEKATLQAIKINSACESGPYSDPTLCFGPPGTLPLRMIAYEDMVKNLDK